MRSSLVAACGIVLALTLVGCGGEVNVEAAVGSAAAKDEKTQDGAAGGSDASADSTIPASTDATQASDDEPTDEEVTTSSEAAAPSDAPPASEIDFGDDSSIWSNDGECDDPRFEGPGMTNTLLLDEDILSDATDCREAYERGQLTLR